MLVEDLKKKNDEDDGTKRERVELRIHDCTLMEKADTAVQSQDNANAVSTATKLQEGAS